MTYIPKPKVHHPALQKNAVGLTRRDYEGSITTLCAGCGHDSVTAAIVQAFWEMSIVPHRVAKISGMCFERRRAFSYPAGDSISVSCIRSSSMPAARLDSKVTMD